MMKKSVRKLALLGALVATSAYATEMRTPWIVGDGPLRYTFEKLKQDKYNFNWWSAFHMKESHKAFLKHGTDTHPITALIFNKDNFKYNEIFPNSEVPMNTEFYNPFFRLLSLQPRVSYMEYGLTFGARWDYPVWKDKGRIGLRVSMPFRRIEMERDDVTDKNEDPLSYVRASKPVKVTRRSPLFDIDQAGAAAIVGGSLRAIGAAAAGGANAQAETVAMMNASSGAALPALAPNITAVGATAANATAAAVTFDTPMHSAAAPQAVVNAVYALAVGTDSVTPAAAATLVQDATLNQVLAATIAKAAFPATLAQGAAAPLPNAVPNNINAAANRGDRSNAPTTSTIDDWNLAYVASLPDGNFHSIVQIPAAVGEFNVLGNNIATAVNERNIAAVGVTRGDETTDIVSNGFVGWMPAPVTNAVESLVTVGAGVAAGFTGDVQPVAADLSTPPATQVGFFNAATDYRTLTADAANGGELTQASLDNAQQLWLTARLDADANDQDNYADADAQIAIRKIAELSRLYTENPLLFFERQGYTLDDQIRSGLGDIDLDLFYEHTFNKEWMGELMLGVRFPTGGDQDKYGSPYKVMLGNGEHWEIKLGGLIAWQPIKWMNIKVDAKYSFVIEGDEHRMAAFKGAKVKNFGPRADADVDWGYFVGHVDFNFFHPKTSDIRAMMGYEFYYKTEDHVDYKQSKMQSWLGRVWDPVNLVWKDNPQDLDSHLARKNTEAISHKCRGEISWQAHKYLELFAGVSSTFAGQNAFRDRDAHGGVNIRF